MWVYPPKSVHTNWRALGENVSEQIAQQIRRQRERNTTISDVIQSNTMIDMMMWVIGYVI